MCKSWVSHSNTMGVRTGKNGLLENAGIMVKLYEVFNKLSSDQLINTLSMLLIFNVRFWHTADKHVTLKVC